MEHIAAIMMLVGCSSANVDCREIAAPSVGFETVEECQALLRPAVDSVRERFKVTYGKCAPVDPALFLEDATISWEITPAGELDVSVTDDDIEMPVLVAAKGSRPTVLSN